MPFLMGWVFQAVLSGASEVMSGGASFLGQGQGGRYVAAFAAEGDVIGVEFDQDGVSPKFERDLAGGATATKNIQNCAGDGTRAVTGTGGSPAGGFWWHIIVCWPFSILPKSISNSILFVIMVRAYKNAF